MYDQRDIVVEVIHALAEADGIAPDEIDFTLHEFVDPDVLTKLAASESKNWTFTFQVSDHQVKITSRGQLFVDGRLYRDNCLARR